MPHERYLEAHQARQRPATPYENLLGDVIERAFGEGIHDLAGLVQRLNDSGLPTPGGQRWTDVLYRKEMAALAA